MTEVVAALIWDNDKFMICQRPKIMRELCCGSSLAVRLSPADEEILKEIRRRV